MKGVLQKYSCLSWDLNSTGNETFIKKSARLKRQLLVGQRSLQWKPNLKWLWKDPGGERDHMVIT